MEIDGKLAECPADKMTSLIEVLGRDETQGFIILDRLISAHPGDSRLYFLRGSVLAGLGRIDEALESMTRAVEITPGYDVARFQLGFLHLTSGNPVTAEQTWAPLLIHLAPGHCLSLFVQGLSHLIRDEFEATLTNLKDGISRNTELPQMNSDMQLIIDKVEALLAPQDPADASTSATHLLLQQYKSTTKH